MTEADHADLSRRLALAIGWPESKILDYDAQEYVGILTHAPNGAPCVRLFCYRWPSIIWPIAERYNCFPMRGSWSQKWCAACDEMLLLDQQCCDTAAEAVARAVIGARG